MSSMEHLATLLQYDSLGYQLWSSQNDHLFSSGFCEQNLFNKKPQRFCVGKNPRFDLVWISNGFITNLVQGIGGIGNQLAQEDLLVAVEGVDDQAWWFCKVLGRFIVCHIKRHLEKKLNWTVISIYDKYVGETLCKHKSIQSRQETHQLLDIRIECKGLRHCWKRTAMQNLLKTCQNLSTFAELEPKIPNPRLKHHPLGKKQVIDLWLMHSSGNKSTNKTYQLQRCGFSPRTVPSSMSKASKNVDLSPSLNPSESHANQLLSCKPCGFQEAGCYEFPFPMSTVWGYCMRSIETDSYQVNSSIIWSKVTLGIPESSHVSL